MRSDEIAKSTKYFILTLFTFSQHVQKLRKTRDVSGITAAANGNGSLVTPSKPAPKKTTSTGRKRAAPGSAKGKKIKHEDFDGDDDDAEEFNKQIQLKQEPTSDIEEASPSKSTKRARKTATYVF